MHKNLAKLTICTTHALHAHATAHTTSVGEYTSLCSRVQAKCLTASLPYPIEAKSRHAKHSGAFDQEFLSYFYVKVWPGHLFVSPCTHTDLKTKEFLAVTGAHNVHSPAAGP